jgi:hypothetical protein
MRGPKGTAVNGRQGNPYVAPSTGPAGADPSPGSVLHCGRRVLAWSLLLGTAYGLVAGAATSLQFTYGLSRFGGAEYIPRVIGLSAVRGWGPWGAALVPALTAVVVLHRAGKRSTEVPAIDPRLPLFVAAAVLLLYPIVVLAGCGSALVVWCAGFGGEARGFAATLIDGVLGVDVTHGALASVIDAVVVAAGVRLVGASLVSRGWWLLPKVLVVWAVLQGLAFGMGYLGRWLG